MQPFSNVIRKQYIQISEKKNNDVQNQTYDCDLDNAPHHFILCAIIVVASSAKQLYQL